MRANYFQAYIIKMFSNVFKILDTNSQNKQYLKELTLDM